MKIKIQITVESDDDQPKVAQDVAHLDRGTLRPETLGLGIDGGYVHAKDQQSRAEGWFEVIVGKSMSQDGESSKCFGFVNRYDTKPKRRLFEMLKSQGMQMNQAVTFLSDGGDTVRDLQMYLNPQAEHLLDWFHISMRLTVMSQLAKSIEADDQPNLSAEIEKDLKRLKWNLWHGNVHKALQIVEDLEYALDFEENSQEQRKLLKAVREFGTYITCQSNIHSELRRSLLARRD